MNAHSIEQVQKGKPNVVMATRVPKVLSRVDTPSGGKVLQVFLNSDLRNGHEGLAAVAKKHDIDVSQLQPGQYVLFINAGKDRIKMFAANDVVAYYKSPQGRIDMRTIQLIPKAFQATGRIDYDKALKETVEAALARRKAK